MKLIKHTLFLLVLQFLVPSCNFFEEKEETKAPAKKIIDDYWDFLGTSTTENTLMHLTLEYDSGSLEGTYKAKFLDLRAERKERLDSGTFVKDFFIDTEMPNQSKKQYFFRLNPAKTSSIFNNMWEMEDGTLYGCFDNNKMINPYVQHRLFKIISKGKGLKGIYQKTGEGSYITECTSGQTYKLNLSAVKNSRTPASLTFVRVASYSDFHPFSAEVEGAFIGVRNPEGVWATEFLVLNGMAGLLSIRDCNDLK
jgi:hypothetical protein